MKVVSSKTIHLENAAEASRLYTIVSEWNENELRQPAEFRDVVSMDFAAELLSALVAYGDH